MTKLVIKSDGKKVPFDAKKITKAITRAANDAKLDIAEINQIVGEISNSAMVFAESKDKITTKEIRDMILFELDNIAPRVAAEWRRYMSAKRK